MSDQARSPITVQLTEEQYERALHYAFLLAMRLMYDAYELEVHQNDPRSAKLWSLMREIAAGETVLALPIDIHSPPEQAQASALLVDDRSVATAVLSDQERVFRAAREE